MMARRIAAKDITPECYTVAEFCATHRLGRNTYYKLRKANLGPKTFRLGERVLITKEAAARWRAERDAEAAESARHE